MSVETPIPGVTYYRQGNSWTAKGRPSLTAVERETLQWGTYLPDATTTGLVDPNANFTDVTGNVVFDGAWSGQVIENRRFYGKVSVTGPDITFKNCLFRGPAAPQGQEPIVACTNAGVVALVFEDCEFWPRALTTGTNCISGHHFTLLRCNVHHSVDGVGIIPQQGGRADVWIIASFIHDLVFFSPDPYQNNNATHNDLIQWHGGKGLWLLGNHLLGFYDPTMGDATKPSVDQVVGGQVEHVSGNPYYPSINSTSVLMCNNHVGAPGELTCDSNWIDGGGAALVFSSAPQMTNVGAVINNKFGRNYRNGPDYGILANTGATQPNQTFTLTGNTRWDTGEAFNVRKKGD